MFLSKCHWLFTIELLLLAGGPFGKGDFLNCKNSLYLITLSTIAEYAGLKDSNQKNLATTTENNVLEALKEHGLIDSYEKVGDDSKMPKYIIRRSGTEIK